MAATSPLSIPKIPNNLPQLPKPIKPIKFSSSSSPPPLSLSSDSENEASTSSSSSSSSFGSISLNRRRLFVVGIGLLASSVGISDAKATRIEYYATVGEPLCDMNFAKSGLGYCDVAVGTGVQPPPGELINIHYTARFADGRVFDSSYKRGRPLTMRIGLGKPGTYMYHSHYGMQRSAGLYGMINVAVPDGVAEPFSYDYDRSLAFSDWWHKSTYEQAAGLASIPFVFVGEPQSLLINGRGRFDCSMPGINGVCNQTNPECSPAVLTVTPGKTYRLRIASVTSLAALNFEIEGHNLTVVEADGHYVKPFVVKRLYIYSGETYSVLVKADQDPSRNYWAAINVVARKPETPTGLAILNYYPNHPLTPPPTSPPAGPSWNDTSARVSQSLAIRAHPGHIIPSPATSDRTILLLNTQNKIDGHIKWALNNVSFALPQTPYLVALKYKIDGAFDQNPPPDTYDYKSYDIYGVQRNTNATSRNSIYSLEFNSTVDVILQNANTLSPNVSETHPWHLHGHDFWVLGYGADKFDPQVDPVKYNLVDPIMKNTVPLHPYGWTAIRFRADNPGAWIFHCHIESHFALGMGVVFAEGVDKIGALPNEIMGCGLSRNFIRP